MVNGKKNKTIINIQLPKGYGGNGRGRAGAIGTSIIMANPVLAIVGIVVAFIALLILGGLSLPIIIERFLNPWILAVSIGMAMLISKPSTGAVLTGAGLVGFLFWAFSLYTEYQTTSQICNVPIIGQLTCGVTNVITFIPKIWDFGLYVLVSFIVIFIVIFFKQQAGWN